MADGEAVMVDQRGFFDLDERYAALSAAGDPLERLASVVDFGYCGLMSTRRWPAPTGQRKGPIAAAAPPL